MNQRITPWSSLKTRVTLFALVLFVLSIWALAYLASHLLRDDMQRQSGEQQFSTVSIVASQVNEELANRVSAVELVARQIDARLMSKPAALQSYLEQKPVLQVLFNGGVFVTGVDGTAIADVPLSYGRVGTSYIDRDYISISLNEGKSVIGRPVMGKKLKVPVFSIATPIRNNHDEVIGALVGTVDLGASSFLDRIMKNTYGKTGGYFLAAPQYRLNILATDKSRIMQALPAPGVNPAIDRFVDGYEGTLLYVNPLGVEVLVSAKDIPVPGWKLVANLPTTEAFAPIYAMQQRILWATIMLTLLAGSLFWWMTSRLLRRQLSPMVTAAKMFDSLSSTGQLPQRLPITNQDEIGELIGSFNHLLDSLAQQDATLRESELTFRKLFEDSSDAILLIDGTGVFVECNQAALDLLKLTREQFLLLPPARISPEFQPDGRRSAEAAPEMITLAYSKGLHRFDWTCINSEGGEFIVEVSLMPLAIKGQTMLHTTWRNVTERKAIETELALHRHHLQELVEAKTAELEMAKLAAETANRAKSSFLANMSHELRTPLNGVMGMTALALRRATDPQQKDYLSKATRAVRHLGAVINDILDLSKIEAGRLSLDEAELMLGAVLENLANLINHSLEEKRLGLVVNISAELAALPLRGDPMRLTQILLNLTGNAIKFTDQGSIAVRIVVVEDNPADMWLRFEVCDTGIGISADDQQRLFNAFEQVDDSMTRKYSGTGLGLAISKRLIEAMGGSIGVESQTGEGSTFWFVARFTKGLAIARETPAPTSDPAELVLGRDHRDKRLLIVEDDEDNRYLTLAQLKNIWPKIDVAADGVEAVELATNNRYDLILMDMRMPHMDGLEATRRIRQLPDGAKVPIVAMTANVFSEDRERCREAGMNDFIAKAAGSEAPFEILLKWLDQPAGKTVG